MKEQYSNFLKSPLFAFYVVYQCGYVSNTGEEDSLHNQNLGLFSQELQPHSPSTSPNQKSEEYPSSGF